MSTETPNPQPGDRVRVTYEGIYEVTPHGALLASDGSPKRSIFDDATVEVLERALCAEIEGATGIRCQQPTGHVDGHKGTTTEDQTKAVGYPLFVSWPAESEPPARRSVRVENGPHGPSPTVRILMANRIAEGRAVEAVGIAHDAGMDWHAARVYVESMSEYQTYLSEHGRTEVDPAEADRMRAMGFDKQPEFQVSDEDRALIQSVLDERTTEYVYEQGDGSWKLDGAGLSGVVADIVWAAIKRDRERGGR